MLILIVTRSTSKLLSNALEGSGTVTSTLEVPWNTCGVFLTGILGVSTWEYAKFAFLTI